MKPSISNHKTKFIKQFIIIVIWIGIWQSIYIYVGKDILIPSPLDTLRALGSLIVQGDFYANIIATLYRVAIGVGISLGAGILTAILAYFVPIIEEIFKPLIVTLKSTPLMAVIILALLWFKSGEVPVFSCFLMCYPIVYTNVLTGLVSVDQGLLEMAQIYKVRGWYLIKDIYMPHTKSYIQAAISLSIGLAWKVVVAAEVLSVPRYSMGYNLLNAKVYLETAELFAWVIVIIILSSLCEKIINELIFKKSELVHDRNKKLI